MLPLAVRLVLDRIGRSEEYEFYLRKFRAADGRAICLVPDREVLGASLDAFLTELSWLKELELPLVVLFSGPLAALNRQEFAEAARSRGLSLALHEERAALPVALSQLPSVSRLFFVRSVGPLRDTAGGKLAFYNINAPSTLLPADSAVAALGAQILARGTVQQLAICAPHSILKELFTVKGAGTVIRRRSLIQEHSTQDAQVVALIEKSFGRRLRKGALDGITAAYVAEPYLGAMLFEDTPYGAYLSKFAVDTQARGSGVANDLWEHGTTEHPRLFWRSRQGNAINRWYSRLSEGQHRAGPWQIFWKGVAVAALPHLIEYCVSRPEDFEVA